MNIQTTPTSLPLRVMMINSLAPATKLTIVKILSGQVFGCSQLIDLTLLVYSNEKPLAEAFKFELIGCAFCCYNSIEVTSDLPSLTDADVFCFETNFPNPNKIDFTTVDEQFDTLYLIIKVANNLARPKPKTEQAESLVPKMKKEPENKLIKPIIMADGLATIDILMAISKNIPLDVFFCPTPLVNASKRILADYLKVSCQAINEVHVWAANDEIFHVEVERPLLVYDKVEEKSSCGKEVISDELLKTSKMDHTQISASWMKKEFIEKVASFSSKNPYGCIYKAAELAKALAVIWQARTNENGNKIHSNIGVISDGSYGTIKGYPYVLPLVFCGDSWSVNKQYEDDAQVKLEIKRINKIVKTHHDQLFAFCKKFLKDNVIKQMFKPMDEESDSLFTVGSRSSRFNEAH